MFISSLLKLTLYIHTIYIYVKNTHTYIYIYMTPTNSLLPSPEMENSTKQKEPPTTERKGKVVLRGHGTTTRRLLELEISCVWRSARKLNPNISGWQIKQRCILENIPDWERSKALFLTDWAYDNLSFGREVREILSLLPGQSRRWTKGWVCEWWSWRGTDLVETMGVKTRREEGQ